MLELLQDMAKAITTNGAVRQLDAETHLLPCYECPSVSCYGCEFEQESKHIELVIIGRVRVVAV